MATDVTQKTNELIQKLRELSQEAGTSETYLKNLEGIIAELGNLNLGNLEKSVQLLVQFNRNLMLMTGNADAIKQVQTDFYNLGRTIEETNTRSARMSNLGKMGAAGKPGFKMGAEDFLSGKAQRYQTAREQAEALQKDLQNAEKIWKENVRIADNILKQRQSVFEKMGGAGVRRQAGVGIGGTETDVGGGGNKTSEIPINLQSLKDIGLSASAAKNLADRLKELKIESAEVSTPITELSTGITTVTVSAKGAGDSIRRFTAHLGPTGAILQDTQRRFRDFGSAVLRDIVEVMKWTIAIGAIYTPMRKLGEMLEDMKQVQLAMVDVQIVLGNNTNKLNEAFAASAEVATETSSELLGVVQGYSLAAAAASGAETQMGKMVATESLLKNSMILSKLANTDQKTALDTLVGALSQAGLKLTEGQRLLDSWVAVSKKANVSVSQMADTFAIVGSAAQEIGLSLDQINGLVGALGQATNLSGQEIGNAIRGIIAAIQTDKAAAQFAQYGIATKNLSGDMRDFLELLREVKAMQDQGLLNEKQMGALMEAGGAGARRGAQLSALVQSLDKVMSLVAVSEQASGDAEKAMQLEMNTLDASIKRLNNSFVELSQTLGGEGGVLDFLTFITNQVTTLVKGLRDLVSVMKWAAPVLGTFLLMKGIAKTPTGLNILGNDVPKFLQTIFTTQAMGLGAGVPTNPILQKLGATGLGGKYVGTLGGIPLAGGGGVMGGEAVYAPATYASMFATIGKALKSPLFPQENLYQTPLYGSQLAKEFSTGLQFAIPNIFKKVNAASLLGPAAIAATNIGRPLEEGVPRAITGAIGAIPGILMGNPLWATIGSIIATGFYDKFLTLEPDMAQKWLSYATENPQVPTTQGQPVKWADQLAGSVKQILTGVPPTTVPPEKAPEKTLDETLKDLDESLLKNMSATEKLNINIFQKTPGWALPKGTNTEEFRKLQSDQATALLAVYAAQKQGMNVYGQPFGGQVRPWLTEDTMREIDKYLNTYALKAVEAGIETTPIETEKGAQIKAINDLATTESANLMKRALEDIASGAGNVSNLQQAQDVANTLATSVGTLMTAQKYTPGMAPIIPQEAMQVFGQLNTEEATKLNTATSDIVEGLAQLGLVQQQINDLRAQGVNVDQSYLDREKQLNEQIANARNLLPQLYNALKQVTLARLAETQMKPTIEIPEGITEQQLAKAIELGRQMWMEYLKSQNIPQDQLDAWVAQQSQQILMAKGKIFTQTTNVPQNFLNLGLEKMGLGGGVGITDWRDKFTISSMSSLMAAYKQAVPMFQKLGYTVNEEDNIVLLSDGLERLHFDNNIMQILMNNLIDETKKNGLQGIYNLPEGATFMVPVTAYEMSKATTTEMAGGGGGLGGLADVLAMLAEAVRGVGPTGTETPNPRLNPEMVARNAGEGAYRTEPTKLPEPGLLSSITSSNPLPVMVTNLPIEGFKQDIINPTLPPIEGFKEDILREQNQTNQPSQTSTLETSLNTLNTAIDTLSSSIQNLFKGDFWNILPINPTSMVPQSQQQTAPVSTALNLDMKSTIVLTVDGRTLATIIKPFLYQDMIRYMTSANSSVNRSVIG